MNKIVDTLSKLAQLGNDQIVDEFSSSAHFQTIRASNSAVADAVKRRLEQKNNQVAEDAAAIIIEQLELCEKRIEEKRLALGNIRRQESILVNNIQTLAVARAYAAKTNNYLPLMHALNGAWESVDIPSAEFKVILAEIKAERNKAKPDSKTSVAKANGRKTSTL